MYRYPALLLFLWIGSGACTDSEAHPASTPPAVARPVAAAAAHQGGGGAIAPTSPAGPRAEGPVLGVPLPLSPLIAASVRANEAGLVAHRGGDFARAEAAFREAIGIDARYALAHFNLASALARLGRWDDALEALRAALRTDAPRVMERVDRDADVALIRGERAAELDALLRATRDELIAALDAGVVVMTTPVGHYAGYRSHITKSMEVGVYLPSTRRFVPIAPEVTGVGAALVDRETRRVLLVRISNIERPEYVSWPVARPLLFDLAEMGRGARELRMPRRPSWAASEAEDVASASLYRFAFGPTGVIAEDTWWLRMDPNGSRRGERRARVVLLDPSGGEPTLDPPPIGELTTLVVDAGGGSARVSAGGFSVEDGLLRAPSLASPLPFARLAGTRGEPTLSVLRSTRGDYVITAIGERTRRSRDGCPVSTAAFAVIRVAADGRATELVRGEGVFRGAAFTEDGSLYVDHGAGGIARYAPGASVVAERLPAGLHLGSTPGVLPTSSGCGG